MVTAKDTPAAVTMKVVIPAEAATHVTTNQGISFELQADAETQHPLFSFYSTGIPTVSLALL